MLGHSHALSGAVTGIAAGIFLHLPVPQVAALAGSLLVLAALAADPALITAQWHSLAG